MSIFEVRKFTNGTLELEVNVSLEDDTVWLTKEQMSLLFNRDRSVISKHINNIYKEGELKRQSTCAKNAHIPQTRNRYYEVDIYNLDVIISVGNRIKSQNGLILKEWFENYKLCNLTNNIIVYNNGIVRLDVNIEPINDTVWLSVNQMALLFDTSTDNIYLHIKNIYEEGELEDSVTEESSATQKELLQKASDGKTYLTKLYNLDVILAVGYRVKGKRAIEFRKWASSVLKQYLLKGYAIDKDRTLITNENYINLINDVNNLKHDISEIKEILKNRSQKSYICYQGNNYEAYYFINNLLCSAKNRVIIIDGYADNTVFDFFIGSKKGIKKVIICHKKDRIDEPILDRFVKQYGETTIKEDKSYHDRFIIIDNDIYLLGVSLNSLGNKTSAITKTDQYKVEDIYKDE